MYCAVLFIFASVRARKHDNFSPADYHMLLDLLGVGVGGSFWMIAHDEISKLLQIKICLVIMYC